MAKQILNNIVTGILKESYWGYSKGAKVYFCKLSVSGGFCIINDIQDENFGFSIDTSKSPELENEQKIELSEIENSKFWIYYKLITSKIKIPVTFDLNFKIIE